MLSSLAVWSTATHTRVLNQPLPTREPPVLLRYAPDGANLFATMYMQREQIRKTVLAENNEVEFQLPETRAAKDFSPAVGATLPKGIEAQSLPTPVLSQIPELQDYTYVKMKDHVLIVNGMTKKIVDMFSETQPLP